MAEELDDVKKLLQSRYEIMFTKAMATVDAAIAERDYEVIPELLKIAFTISVSSRVMETFAEEQKNNPMNTMFGLSGM